MHSRINKSVLMIGLFLFEGIAWAAGSEKVGWKSVDEGVIFSVPNDWQKVESGGIDSNVGAYCGKNAYLEFEELLRARPVATRPELALLQTKKSDRRLLASNEELWELGERVALFSIETANVEKYGRREFGNVATLLVPYEEVSGYLSVTIFYKDKSELPMVCEILRSVRRARMR